jgi:cytoskeletal protein RodZ
MSDSNNAFLDNNKNNTPLFNGESDSGKKVIQKPKPPVLNIKPPKGGGILKKTKEPVEEVDGLLSLGAFLQEARVKADYSFSQVAMITKLSIHYIEAIERNDFENAPPYIYVKAYVKKLCELYGVDESKAVSLLKPFGARDKVVSDSILQELEESKQINEKEEKKIVFIIKTVLISFVTAVIIAIILYFCFGGSDSETPKVSDNPQIEKQVVQKKMEKLVVPQTLTPSELKIPESK